MKLTRELETRLQVITESLPDRQRHFLRSMFVLGDSMSAAKATGTDLNEYRSWQADPIFAAAFTETQDLQKNRLSDLVEAMIAAAFRTLQDMSRNDRAELRRLVAEHKEDKRTVVDLIHEMVK